MQLFGTRAVFSVAGDYGLVLRYRCVRDVDAMM